MGKYDEAIKKLTPLQYKVTQQKGTEPPFQNEYNDEKREGIYVDIVSKEVLFSSLDKFNSGSIYNLSGGKHYSVKNIISIMEELSGKKLDYKSVDTFKRANEIKYSQGDSQKFRNDYNWMPQYSLKETLEWMLNN